MTKRSRLFLFSVLALAGGAFATPASAEDYKLDAAHTSVVFKIAHLETSYTFGMFEKVAGHFALGDNPNFEFTVSAESIDTNNKKRDDHLRSPDFFNVKQFPTITLKSTKVEESDEGYRLTGDLTLHGVTKPITVQLTKVGGGEDPWGNYRVGFDTTFTIKRSDFGMDKMMGAVGDAVTLMVSFEGIREQ